jgi:hypothetical protein
MTNTEGGYDPKAYRTSDGVPITPGLRVLTNELQWGTVAKAQFSNGNQCAPGGAYFNGWFEVIYDDGTFVLQDGGRITTTPPAGAPADPKADR